MSLQNFKDALASFRELLLVLTFLLLLTFPGCVNTILVKAGFTDGSVMGFNWKQKAIESNDVADSSQMLAETAIDQLDQLQSKLDSVSNQLNAALIATENKKVDTASVLIEDSKKSMAINTPALKSRLRFQAARLKSISKDMKAN